MRIAFVGKGGSGKTTLAALFTQHLAALGWPALAVDADLNLHLPALLGFDPIPAERHLSSPGASDRIRSYLRGANDWPDLAAFRKTTPPTRRSKLLGISELGPLGDYVQRRGSLALAAVGTYDSEHIGASCYHNNLAILENILSHLLDASGYVVADMVAGVDAFANTLHAQFDLLVLTVEPTQRSVEVFQQYVELADAAGVGDRLAVVGNRVRDTQDESFLRGAIPEAQLLGLLPESSYLRTLDREGGDLDLAAVEGGIRSVLPRIHERLAAQPSSPQARLEKLWQLHRTYVAQPSIRERFGDLTNQIDEDFRFPA